MFKRLYRLMGMIGAARRYLIVGVIARSVFRFLIAIMTANLFADAAIAIQQGDTALLWQALGGAVPILLGAFIAQIIATYVMGRAATLGCARMRSGFMQAMLDASVSDGMKHSTGVKLSYLNNDIPIAMRSLGDALEIPVRALVMGLGSLIYIISVSPVTTGVIFGLGAYGFTYSVLFAGALFRLSGRVHAGRADMADALKTFLDGIIVARMDQMRAYFAQRFEKFSAASQHIGIKWANLSAVLGCVNNISFPFAEKALVFAAGLMLIAGILDVGTMLRVSQLAMGATSVFFISRSLHSIQESLSGAQRVFDALDGAPKEKTGSVAAPVSGEAAIEFSDVEFGYYQGQSVLKGVSFAIREGETVALTGESGSGKTTILRLIQALYAPGGGQIKVMGADVRTWDVAKLRQVSAQVMQDHALVAGTVYENIALGAQNATRQEVVAAARAAGAHEFIEQLPQGYDEAVSERGGSLSGGQRQRIAIARALLRDAPILLMDEATSALDSEAESVIAQTIAALKGKKTIVIVAHKPSTIAMADRVLAIG